MNEERVRGLRLQRSALPLNRSAVPPARSMLLCITSTAVLEAEPFCNMSLALRWMSVLTTCWRGSTRTTCGADLDVALRTVACRARTTPIAMCPSSTKKDLVLIPKSQELSIGLTEEGLN
eukprot:6195166-Pleurochrysis_carterae.AAC.1